MTSGNNDEARMLALMDAMFHGQKRTLTLVEAAIDKFSVVETEISKLNRKMNSMHEVTLRQHGEVMSKFDAIASRMEETERLLDDRSLDVKRAQIDLVGQYNEILTALQLSVNASRDVAELDERLSDLERRMQA